VGWVFSAKEMDVHKTFIDTLREAIDTYGYPVDKPRDFFIDGNKFDD